MDISFLKHSKEELMIEIAESRQIKDLFLVKEIVDFLYHKNYTRIKKRVVSKPSTKIGTPNNNYEDIIKLLDSDKDYLIVSDFLILSKRAVKNEVYILNYEELLTWISAIDNSFEGPFSIVLIEKSNPDSFIESNLIFYVIEEGVFFLIENQP